MRELGFHRVVLASGPGRLVAAACALAVLVACEARAQTLVTWDGDTSTTFSSGSNWVGGTAPNLSSATANIGVFGAEFGTFAPRVTANAWIGGLQFERPEGGWTVTIDSGRVLQIGRSGIDASSMTSSGTLTFDGNVDLRHDVIVASGSPQTWNSGAGTIVVTGTLRAQSHQRIVVPAGSTVRAAYLDGIGTTNYLKDGPGTLIATGPAGSLMQPFGVNQGTVIVGDGKALSRPSQIGTMGFGVVNQSTNTPTLQASKDLTGADALTNSLNVLGLAPVISGNYSIEISGSTFRSSADNNNGSKLTNNIVAGKQLILNQVSLNSRIEFDGSGATVIQGDVSGGSWGRLAKFGTGSLTLGGTATYAGTTTVNAGLLMLSTTAAVTGTAVRPYTVAAAATLATGFAVDQAFLGRIVTTSTGVVALGTNSANALDFSSGGANLTAASLGAVGSGTQVFTGSLTPNGTTYRLGGGGGTLDFQSALSGSNSLVLGGPTTGVGGTVLLSGTTANANSYTGKTTLQSGTLEISSIANVNGGGSSLGAPTNSTNGTIDLGSAGTAATLRYVGSGHSTDRVINLAAGGGTLDASGAGPVSFTGGVTGVAGTTLTLTGSNTGANSITAVTGSNVTKTGVGTWVFGTNSFTGRLSIEQGTIVAASNAANSGTATSLGAFNGPIPLIGLADATGTAALLAANGVTIARIIEVAALGSGSQEVILGGSGAGEATFDGNSAIRLGRGVTLAADPGGNVKFQTPTANWDQQDGTDNPAVAITIGTPTATGTVTFETRLPDSITAVTVRQGTLRLAVSSTFTGATPVTVGSAEDSATLDLAGLGQTVQSLSFGGTAGLVLPGGGSGVLRLAGVGPTVTVASGSGHRIDAPLALDATTTFAVSSAAARLAVNGGITDGVSGAQGLAKSGSGTLVLAALNTYTGTTSVAAGTILVSGSGRIASSALIDVGAAGTLVFDRTDDYGGAYDGKLAGSGLVSVQSGSLTLTGLNTFAGSSEVLSGAVLKLDGQINNTTLDVASGATLMGSGTILGTTTIAGLHRPGNSPGIQTLGNLTYLSGASVQWELWGNTTTNGSPPDYDQIVLTGDLAFDAATSFNLVFTGSAGPTDYSDVDWANSFWDSNREWLVYDVAGTTTGFGSLSLVQTNWLDSTGADFTTARSMASFRLEKRPSNDVYLVYSSIPEPGSLVLAGIGLAAVAWAARRRCRGRAAENPEA